MPLSIVDLYSRVLPRTNCGECGYSTCMAFASMVVSKKLPLSRCPYLTDDTLARFQPELDAQHAAGKWTERDMAADALNWARERASSHGVGGSARAYRRRIERCWRRAGIGAAVLQRGHPYPARGHPEGRRQRAWSLGTGLCFQPHGPGGGGEHPPGRWKALQDIPNTVSKIKSMRSHIEEPLRERFSGRLSELAGAAVQIGGTDVKEETESADLAFRFHPLPRVPVLLLFWDADREGGFDAEVKLSFDETITEHLDIESILFLSEHLAKLLMGE